MGSVNHLFIEQQADTDLIFIKDSVEVKTTVDSLSALRGISVV
jgi:hypothetical protein